jgi:hypothetical protein
LRFNDDFATYSDASLDLDSVKNLLSLNMQSSSLSTWTLRLQRQCAQVLDPETLKHSEIDATEQLTRACDDNPSWTLMGLAQLAKDDDASSVCFLPRYFGRWSCNAFS